jgi:hypothetical protein
MGYKTVSVDVDVDIDLDEFDDLELVEEMKHRGYSCVNGDDGGMNREDWQFLIELIDETPATWYSRRVRDKLMAARYG